MTGRGDDGATRVLEAERERDRAIQELQALAYAISHDLRAPLRAIDGFSQALAFDCADTLAPEALRHLERIREGAQELGARIDALLELSSLGARALHLQTVDMTGLAGEVAAELRGAESGRTIDVRIEPLPDACCDPEMVRRLLRELLSNAIKFTRQAQAPTIRVGHDPDPIPAYVVSDNGVGFDMRYAPKLFRMFGRLHRVQDFEGAGVGLALAARIASRHGGEMWARAEPDAGATLHFTLGSGGATPAEAAPCAHP